MNFRFTQAVGLVGAITGPFSRYPASMDIVKAVVQLRHDLAEIDKAILALEELARGWGKRRGRPPAWMADPAAPEPPSRPRKGKRKSTNKEL